VEKEKRKPSDKVADAIHLAVLGKQAAIAAGSWLYRGGWTLIADAAKEAITKSKPATPLIRHGLAEVSMFGLHVACCASGQY
jgi:hypothetical protein